MLCLVVILFPVMQLFILLLIFQISTNVCLTHVKMMVHVLRALDSMCVSVQKAIQVPYVKSVRINMYSII